MNKKGWVKILEVFLAIMLISGILLIMVHENSKKAVREEPKIPDIQDRILKEIQLNETVRNDVLGVSKSELPLNDSDESFPKSIKEEINKTKPFYLDCKTSICKIDSPCEIGTDVDSDVFVDSIGIFSNLTKYNPRKIKLGCWEV